MKVYMNVVFSIFGLTLLYLFLYKLWLLKVPELFTYAYELGEIFYQLSMAYIASFIFYLLVTYWPQKKQKEHVYDYVNHKVVLILTNFMDILQLTSSTEATIKHFNYETTEEEYLVEFPEQLKIYRDEQDYNNIASQRITDFFSFITYGGGGPITKVYKDEKTGSDIVTWGDYLEENVRITNKLVSEILNLIPFLEPQHVTLLSKIQDAPYHYEVLEKHPGRRDAQKLEFLAPSYLEYYTLMKLLAEEFSLSLNELDEIPNAHVYIQNIGARNT